MGTSLTGLTPSTTYDALIKVGDNGALSATAKVLSDGLGNDSPLAMSTTLVGINTISPSAILSIFKSADSSITVNTATTGTFPIKSGISFGAPSTSLGGDSKYSGGAGIQGLNIMASDNITDLMFWTTAGGSPSEKVRITSTGNVGIGTSSPSDKLNLLGTDTTAYVSSSASAVLPAGGSNLVIQNNGTAGYSSLRFVSLDGSNAFGYLGFINSTGVSGSFVFGQRTGGNSYAEQMRLSNDGYLRLATGGIQFNGDTSASNALDDYEEGTFTPSIAFGGSSTGITYFDRQGIYTKIGRQVTCQMYIALTNVGSATGDASIEGLPFTSGNISRGSVSAISISYASISSTGQLTGLVGANGTQILLSSTSVLGSLTVMNNTNFTSSTEFRAITVTYFTP